MRKLFALLPALLLLFVQLAGAHAHVQRSPRSEPVAQLQPAVSAHHDHDHDHDHRHRQHGDEDVAQDFAGTSSAQATKATAAMPQLAFPPLPLLVEVGGAAATTRYTDPPLRPPRLTHARPLPNAPPAQA